MDEVYIQESYCSCILICKGPAKIPYTYILYFLAFINDFSQSAFIYPLEDKKNIYKTFFHFKAMAEYQIGNKLKVLRTDSDLEYLLKNFKNALEKEGI